ncbi:JmjC domain hydroxylase [Leishmania donovani]|uniref:JmjC_domain_-_hydroxylase_-_putative n=3 Tax=Leishmania donovani species complex TaxID=38574 RepID=A0A6L0XHK4_LEIIN|nr:conserved hypothetical protein [Leishmania infantum JPCM5]XP_003861958.1 hypothetical protein, conserved [Leishmania donovani]CAC9499532.1 JmjC_domain_-_hydroxylase_-_putative [Leishmania infantum]AYU79998.1 JmjC domain, hydroxylase, putative [Leishmania donovani]TPP46077.1 JmjC domain, hydroxylase family protein [Leishmania donovani]TPP47536.1 JmjC domain, hydroxylase family protein [Leishmania donovani]CAJ1989982.1 JmjC domain hydroxylase [Leishmania donovani]|eukprot:XP_001466349.1 conserved hypothetical protein [Leishmania infantum JPCM5]
MLELDGTTLTYEGFRDACLRPNRPAVIRNACRDASGGICFDLAALKRRLCPRELCRCLGSQTLAPVYPVPSTAQVTSCDSTPAARDERRHEPPTTVRDEVVEADEEGCCKTVPLEAVLHSWAASTSAAACSPSPPHVYYLKDWHLQAALESTAATETVTTSSAASSRLCEYAKSRASGTHGDGLYRVPRFLGADWMDSFCCRHVVPSNGVLSKTAPAHDTDASTQIGFGNGESDYRFCYIGPVGSWTPLHYDVFGTYSWSFNVCGDKNWYFPTVAGNAYLHDHLFPLFPTPPDIRVLTGFELEAVVQHPGDLVFVPAFFYHQVHNITGEVFPLFAGEGAAVEDDRDQDAAEPVAPAEANEHLSAALTVSLNHNWCNTFNVERMVKAFLADARQLASHLSIEDLALICDTRDSAVWRRFADRLLHNGTNWSFASMTCFLDHCLAQLDSGVDAAVGAEDERGAAADELHRLRGQVAEEYAHLLEEKRP